MSDKIKTFIVEVIKPDDIEVFYKENKEIFIKFYNHIFDVVYLFTESRNQIIRALWYKVVEHGFPDKVFFSFLKDCQNPSDNLTLWYSYYYTTQEEKDMVTKLLVLHRSDKSKNLLSAPLTVTQLIEKLITQRIHLNNCSEFRAEIEEVLNSYFQPLGY